MIIKKDMGNSSTPKGPSCSRNQNELRLPVIVDKTNIYVETKLSAN